MVDAGASRNSSLARQVGVKVRPAWTKQSSLTDLVGLVSAPQRRRGWSPWILTAGTLPGPG